MKKTLNLKDAWIIEEYEIIQGTGCRLPTGIQLNKFYDIFIDNNGHYMGYLGYVYYKKADAVKALKSLLLLSVDTINEYIEMNKKEILKVEKIMDEMI